MNSISKVSTLLKSLIAGLLVGTSLMAAAAGSADEFVRDMYAAYSSSGQGRATLGDDASKLFSKDLLELIREDQRTSEGEIGLLDHDPICSCQDVAAFRVLKIQVVPLATADRAKASVSFSNGGKRRSVVLFLKKQAEQWRISDIREDEVPSLFSFLKNGLETANTK